MTYYVEMFFLLALLSLLFYKWSTRNYRVFERRGVVHVKPMPLIGNVGLELLFGKSSFLKETIEKYNKYKKHKIFGDYSFMDPVFVIYDIELIKKVGIKDFDHFVNHNRIEMNDCDDVMSKTLIALRDRQWKEMRNILTPSFTGSKMRLMHQFVNECCQKCVNFIDDEIKQHKKEGKDCELELKDLYSRYANDIIATVAFGIQVDSLKEQNNKFYESGKALSQFKTWLLIKALLFVLVPKVMKFLRASLMDQAVMQYFRGLVFDAIKYRQQHNIVRPDMIHLLLEAKKNVEATNNKGVVSEEGHVTLDDDELLAQCLIFFVAGFETVSNCLCFTFYELVMNPDVQAKLYEEIMSVDEQLNGKPLEYDTLQKMQYLDMVLSESLRKWPPVIATDRVCTADCTLKTDAGDMSVDFKKGDIVHFHIVALQRDPAYFPEPEKFIPERFSEEQKDSIEPCSYLPFGIGPRLCIGNRLALMETKTMVYNILKNFKINATEKTPVNLMDSIKGFQTLPEEKFWMKFSPRNNSVLISKEINGIHSTLEN